MCRAAKCWRALTRAAATAGDRLVAIWNAKLPDKPTAKISAKLLEVLRRDPNGVESYFAWLAEEYPAIFCSLLGRALPQIIQHEDQGAIDIVYISAEEIAAKRSPAVAAALVSAASSSRLDTLPCPGWRGFRRGSTPF